MFKIYDFSEIEIFLDQYKPNSPYGIVDKNLKKIYCHEKELEALFKDIDVAISFIKDFPLKRDKIEYHLKRIPHLRLNENQLETSSEIQCIKKFLFNFQKIEKQLNETTLLNFQFTFHSNELLELLFNDGNLDESFYLSENYSNELAEIRRKIEKINKQLSVMKSEKIDLIKELYSFNFTHLEFIVLPESDLPHNSDKHLFVESYDHSSVLIKPILGHDYYHIDNSRKELLIEEKRCEKQVIKDLSLRISKESDQLNDYQIALKRLDTSLAKGKLALKHKCTRATFNSHNGIYLCEGRFIPLEERLKGEKQNYKPLTAEFQKRNIVINGSNMGGKTVVLKSILFLQLLAQRGFFVPAKSFETPLFDNFNLIGSTFNQSIKGLSSFGEEILKLIQAKKGFRTLFIVDEFARTTNIREGKALYCGLLRWFSENEVIYSFSTTHEEKLPSIENLSYWQMNGLDSDKYKTYYHKDFNKDLNQRIALINNYMDYGISPLNELSNRREALRIADILGLDSNIIKYAKKYYEEQE